MFSIISIVFSATSQHKLLPPNVEPWSPGSKLICSFDKVTPKGRPPAIPLARVTMSGDIPSY